MTDYFLWIFHKWLQCFTFAKPIKVFVLGSFFSFKGRLSVRIAYFYKLESQIEERIRRDYGEKGVRAWNKGKS